MIQQLRKAKDLFLEKTKVATKGDSDIVIRELLLNLIVNYK